MRFIWKKIIAPILLINNPEKNNLTSEQIIPKKCIHFGTGAIGGFYQLGVAKFISEHYDTDDYVFSGTSAGSWCATLLASGFRPADFDNVIYQVLYELKDKSNKEFWAYVIKTILDITKDITLKPKSDNLYIATAEISPLPKRKFISNFSTFQNATQACVVSSYIPFLLGKTPLVRYNDTFMCDGGILGDRDVPENTEPILKINPDFWGREIQNAYNWNYTFAIHLYNDGYQDSKKNKWVLDHSLIKDKSVPYIKEVYDTYDDGSPCCNNY